MFAIESFANLKNACLIRKGEWLSIEDRMEMPSFEVKPISDYFLINAEDYLQKKGMLNIIWWAFINSNRDNTYTLTITDEWGQQYEVVSDVFDAITIELMTEIRRFDNLKDKRFERVGEYLRIIGD